MTISVQTLLAKIEKELQLAKSSGKQESLREKVYSIKILCELILDEKAERTVAKPVPVMTNTVSQQPAVNHQAFQPSALNQPVFQQPASMPQTKKIEMDEANGDSLFDF
ncbi:YwdI family protein [Neobacillus sp. 19]